MKNILGLLLVLILVNLTISLTRFTPHCQDFFEHYHNATIVPGAYLYYPIPVHVKLSAYVKCTPEIKGEYCNFIIFKDVPSYEKWLFHDDRSPSLYYTPPSIEKLEKATSVVEWKVPSYNGTKHIVMAIWNPKSNKSIMKIKHNKRYK